MEKTIRVLDPTAKPGGKETQINPLSHDLNGKVIGFLWNHKPNGDILLNRIKEQLSRRYQLAGTVWQHWEGGGTLPEASIIDALASTADMVVIAIGD